MVASSDECATFGKLARSAEATQEFQQGPVHGWFTRRILLSAGIRPKTRWRLGNSLAGVFPGLRLLLSQGPGHSGGAKTVAGVAPSRESSQQHATFTARSACTQNVSPL